LSPGHEAITCIVSNYLTPIPADPLPPRLILPSLYFATLEAELVGIGSGQKPLPCLCQEGNLSGTILYCSQTVLFGGLGFTVPYTVTRMTSKCAFVPLGTTIIS